MTRIQRKPFSGLAAIALTAGIVGVMGMAGCKSKNENADPAADKNGAASSTSSSLAAATPTPSHDFPGAQAPPSVPDQAGTPGAPAGQPPAAAAPAKPITPSGPPKQVVAKVNGQPITRGMLDFMLKNVMREQGIAVPPERHAEMRRRVLDDLISKELLYQKASASKFTVSPTEVADTLTKIKADFPNDMTFQTKMAEDGMDQPTVELMIRQGTAIDKFLKSTIESKVTITPDEETKFYEANKERFKHPEQIRASHILLRVEDKAPEEVKQAQKAKAADLDARAKKGEDFAALAKANSQDPGSAARGGDLGWFGKGQMVPAFDSAAWALKKGEISPVVQSPFGFHIIKETDRRPEGFVPFGEVRDRIRGHLSTQKVQDETQKIIDVLRTTAKIEVTL